MAYHLPELPYSKDSFGATISSETFDYHYGKHHQTYITNLNNLIKGTEWENKTLDEIVVGCKDQKIFNNAAQHWNHTFYWYCLTPEKNEPTGPLLDAINSRWGSVQKFTEDFSSQAVANFGSGWTWLAKQGNDIAIVNTSNAGNPLTSNYQPLLTVDIWEHAYYIDYRNARAKYVENFSNLINWKFVEGNFSSDKVTIKL